MTCGVPAVRCSARSTMKAPNRRPPQMRCADSQFADASSKSTSRRAGFSGASTLVAAARASAAMAVPTTRFTVRRSKLGRYQLELVEQLEHDEHRDRRGERAAGEDHHGGQRLAVARADAAHDGMPAPPARQSECENRQPDEREARESRARGAALLARIGDPVLAELHQAAAVVGRGRDDVAPEEGIEHVGRAAEQGLRIGRAAPVRQRIGKLVGAGLQQLHLLDRRVHLGALPASAARARPRSRHPPAPRPGRARGRGPSAARRCRPAAARDRRACRASGRAAARSAAPAR